jgi:hypothetical protein
VNWLCGGLSCVSSSGLFPFSPFLRLLRRSSHCKAVLSVYFIPAIVCSASEERRKKGEADENDENTSCLFPERRRRRGLASQSSKLASALISLKELSDACRLPRLRQQLSWSFPRLLDFSSKPLRLVACSLLQSPGRLPLPTQATSDRLLHQVEAKEESTASADGRKHENRR